MDQKSPYVSPDVEMEATRQANRTKYRVYCVLAGICTFLAVAGIWQNFTSLAAGVGVPTDSPHRQAYITGLFSPAALLLLLAGVFWWRARRWK
jgi:hypothetical protein